MKRIQPLLLVLLVFLSFMGCGKKVAVQPKKPAVSATKPPQAPSPAPKPVHPEPPDATSAAKPSDAENPGSTSPAKPPKASELPGASKPEASADAPPQPFSGKNEDPNSPIPPDVQQALRGFGGNEAKKIELMLTYPHPQVRKQAAQGLQGGSEELKPKIVQALRGALKDPNAEVRKEVAIALSYHLPEAKTAVRELAPLVSDTGEGVAYAALNTLEQLGPDAGPALPELLAALDAPEHPSRSDVMEALGAIGPAARPAIPKLVTQLERLDNGADACKALGKIGAQAQLLAALSHKDQFVRSWAAEGAAYLPEYDPPIVEKLSRMVLEEEYEYGRSHVAEALGKVKPCTKEIVATLVKASTDRDESVRRAAVESLGIVEPKFDEAIPALVKASSDKEEWVRNAATQSLGKYKGSPEVRLQVIVNQVVNDGELNWSAKSEALREGKEEFYPLLKKTAQDEAQDEVRRGVALLAMRLMVGESYEDEDPRRAELVAMATPWLDETQPATMRGVAASVIKRIEDRTRPSLKGAWMAAIKGSKFREGRLDAMDMAAGLEDHQEIIPVLIEALADPDVRIIESAARNLERFGPESAAAAQPLIQLAKKPEFKEKKYIFVKTLGEIGPDPKIAIPFLTQLLDEQEEGSLVSTPAYSAQALAKIIAKNDLDAKELLAKILPLMKKAESYQQGSYLEVIGLLGPKGAPAVAAVRPFLASKEEYQQHNAAETLGKIGPAAKDAALDLVAAADSWKEPQTAIEALGQIKHGGKEFAKFAPKLLDQIDLRYSVLTALGELGGEAKEALPAIVKMLDSQEAADRAAALGMLAKWGDAALPALPRIKELVASESEEYVREQAGKTLLAIAPGDPALLQTVFADGDEISHYQAKEVLERLGKQAPQIISQGLTSEEPGIRKAALQLATFALPPEELLAHYERALTDKDQQVQVAAATRLCLAEKSSAEVLQALVDGLGNDQNREAGRALAAAGRAAVPLLAATILDEKKSPKQRQAAVDVLYQSAASPRQVAALLTIGLKSESADTQFFAACALASNSHLTKEIAPLLQASLRAGDGDRVKAAIRACQMLPWAQSEVPPELVSAILDLVAGDDEELANLALGSLGYDSVNREDASAALKLLENEKTRARGAEILLRQTESKDDRLVPLLAAGLRSAEDGDSYVFAEALLRQGKAGRFALIEIFVDMNASVDTRKQAGRTLVRTRPPEPKQMEQIAALLKSEVPNDRQRAAILLGHWGYDWQPLQEHLLAALKDDSELRYDAAHVMELRVEEAVPAAQELTRLATSEEESKATRDAAIRSLGALSRYVPSARQTVVKKLAKEEEHYNRIQMVQSLAGDDHVGEVVDSILQELTATQGEEAAHLISALQAIDSQQVDAAKVIGQLQPFLDSSDEAVKQATALTLAHFHAGGDATIAVAIKLLDSEDPDERQSAIMAIQTLGPQAKAAVPKLIELLSDPEVAYEAAQTLGEIGPEAVPAAAKLVSMLNDPDLFSSAAQTLARIKPEAVLPALYKELKDPNRRYAALEAISQLEKDAAPAIPVLLKALARDDVELKLTAIDTLGRLKEVAAPAVKDLLPYLTSADKEQRRSVAWALGSIKSQPELCVTALLPALNDPDWEVKIQAARGLGEFKAPQAIEPMRKWLADPKLRGVAIDVLREIGPAAKVAVPELVKIVAAQEDDYDSQQSYLPQSALNALVAMGADAAGAAPELIELRKNASPIMRRKIGQALWAIAPAIAKDAGIPEPAKVPKPRADGS